MNEREALIDGLRGLAAFLETHPDVPRPSSTCGFYVFCANKEEMAQAAKSVGGRLEKSATTNYFMLRKDFGPLRLEIAVEREQICERVVVGTKVVPAKPECVLPATPETVEEVIEWRCSSVLEPATAEVKR